MVDELRFRAYLHKILKHTNRTVPYDSKINGTTDDPEFIYYPSQITDILGTTIEMEYRDHNKCQLNDFRNIPKENIHRPNDDDEYLDPHIGPEDYDYSSIDTYKKNFIILRADAESPYRFIAVSEDYEIMLVSSTEKDSNDNYIFESQICEYPVQERELIGAEFNIQYPYKESYHASSDTRKDDTVSNGYLLRADCSEPCYAIYADKYDENTFRYLLGEEVWGYFKDYTGEIDQYDEDYGRERKTSNIDYPDDGDTNDYHKLYILNYNNDIAETRKTIIEGKQIYGGN